MSFAGQREILYLIGIELIISYVKWKIGAEVEECFGENRAIAHDFLVGNHAIMQSFIFTAIMVFSQGFSSQVS